MQATHRSVAVVVVMVVVLSLLTVTTHAHMLGLGNCRSFEGMKNFDPVRFNGTWYVIKKLVTRSNCLTVNYTMMDDGQGFKVEEARRPPFTDVLPIDLAVTNSGVLNRLDTPSKYSVTWYNGIIPMTGTYIVADTDYNNYAIDYECHNLFGFLKRQSATILSRTPQMTQAKVDELAGVLTSKFDIPTGRLNRVDQDNCIPLDANDFNLVIDEEGFKSALQNYKELKELSKLPKEEVAEFLAQQQSAGTYNESTVQSVKKTGLVLRPALSLEFVI